MAVMFIAPIMVVTIAVDVMLGVVTGQPNKSRCIS
jgi:hypothetical protein